MKAIFLVLATALIASCAFNKDSGTSAQDQRDQENSAKLQGDFAAAQGLYVGTVKALDRDMPVELRLFPQQSESGTSADGQSRPLPLLKAMLTLTDTLEDDAKLSATFKAASGDLTLSIPQGGTKAALATGTSTAAATPAATTTDPGSPVKKPLDYSFVGKLNGVYIDGTLTSNEGVVGTAHLELKSKAAAVITTEERNNRFQKLLAPLGGFYVAKVRTILGRVFPMYLSIVSLAGTSPSLVATCRTDVSTKTMQIEFSPNPKPSKVVIKEQSGSIGCPLNYFDGALSSNGNIEGVTTSAWGKRQNTTLLRCPGYEQSKECLDTIPDPAN